MKKDTRVEFDLMLDGARRTHLEEREAAMQAATQPTYIPTLISTIREEESDGVREFAIEEMTLLSGALGAYYETMVEVLLSRLDFRAEPSASVRWKSIRALSLLAPKALMEEKAAALLRDCLIWDPDREVRRWAIAGLSPAAG